MAISSSVNFSDIFIRQSQNTARLGFEVQFRALKRRLDTELNQRKEAYNNIDKALEPVLSNLKRERKVAEDEKNALESYLDVGKRNINKITSILDNTVTALNSAASDVGGTAESDFNLLRDQLNRALQGLQQNSYFQGGILDRAQQARSGSNPSGIKNYADYSSIPERASSVGILVTGGVDGIEVNSGLSTGYAEKLGMIRYNLVQDFDLMKSKQQQAVAKIKEIDKQIEKKDAQERLVLLREIQRIEAKNEGILKNLSLNFEFQQANAESMADRTSFLKPSKGSIMNLFI